MIAYWEQCCTESGQNDTHLKIIHISHLLCVFEMHQKLLRKPQLNAQLST